MLYDDLKSRVLAHSSNRANLDNIPNVDIKVNIAIERVAKDSIPLALLIPKTSSRKKLRKVYTQDGDAYIAYPNPVDTGNKIPIDIDDDLIDAVALFVLSGIETARAPAYMNMYWANIEAHEQMLIDMDLNSYLVELEDMVDNTPQHSIERNSDESL